MTHSRMCSRWIVLVAPLVTHPTAAEKRKKRRGKSAAPNFYVKAPSAFTCVPPRYEKGPFAV